MVVLHSNVLLIKMSLMLANGGLRVGKVCRIQLNDKYLYCK